jgi:hypothetical protein
MTGQLESARKELAMMRANPAPVWGPSDLMLIEALVGNADEVFEILDEAADGRMHGLVDNIPVCHPMLRGLWSDPRFPALTRRMGIPMCTPTGAPRRTR